MTISVIPYEVLRCEGRNIVVALARYYSWRWSGMNVMMYAGKVLLIALGLLATQSVTLAERPTGDCLVQPCLNYGRCVSVGDQNRCICRRGWTGTRCETDIDDCASAPCVNGQCRDGTNQYTCVCDPGWTGTNCDINVSNCRLQPCLNHGRCVSVVNQYRCICRRGWTGTRCETDINNCSPNPCQNRGSCTNGVDSYTCTCAAGYAGITCDTNINDCSPNPCQNRGSCTDGVDSYTCTCAAGYAGITCDTNINDCSPNPCQNRGSCTDGVDSYTCICAAGYTGTTCDTNINDCSPNPCQNGGRCTDGVDSYTCTCAAGYTGATCDSTIDDTNECLSGPCLNGATCNDIMGSYTCSCAHGWTGVNCEQAQTGIECHDGSCGHVRGYRVSATCENGYCVCDSPDYSRETCLPSVGSCQIQQSDIAAARASYGGTERDTYSCVTEESGPQSIHVLAVYEGNRNTRPPSAGDMDVSLETSSQTNKSVVLVLASYEPVRWILDVPDMVLIDEIVLISYHLDESSVEWSGTPRYNVQITEHGSIYGYGSDSGGGNTVGLLKYIRDNYGPVSSFTGTYNADSWTLDISYGIPIDPDIDECASAPCVNGVCVDGINRYTCVCDSGWTGTNCDTNIDDCANVPCANGLCVDGINQYTCMCNPGWTGTNCNINIDDCVSVPCVNGVCVDGINQYTCVCEPGWTGTDCDINIDDCVSVPCVNGQCVDGINQYTCFCDPGWTGTHCNISSPYPCNCTSPPPTMATFNITQFPENINECASAPCLNNGICVDMVNIYTCQCPPGFTGLRCETGDDTNECLSSPCLNGATCNDTIGSYTCTCASGWTGVNCEQGVSNCRLQPCLNHGRCVSVVDQYRCICRRGWTGTRCESSTDANQCLSNPCLNGATCDDRVGSYTCTCVPGWTGINCDQDVDYCASVPCVNGLCVDGMNQYTCMCDQGWTGTNCDININECASAPCLNNGSCVDTVNMYTCQCPQEFTGLRCETDLTTCSDGSTPFIEDQFCDGFVDCGDSSDERFCPLCVNVPPECTSVLSYNQTYFPNGLSSTLEEALGLFIDTADCHANATWLLCSIIFPECQGETGTASPCRQQCLDIVDSCTNQFEDLLDDCDSFPADQERNCSLPEGDFHGEGICGFRPAIPDTTIVDGDDAVLGAWPWIGSLRPNVISGHRCGVSLISESWAVTAAHCVNGDYSDWVIVFGDRIIDQTSNDEQLRSFDAVIIHRDYTGYRLHHHDIALLHLREPVTFTDFVRPICLTKTWKEIDSFEECWIAGWGSVYDHGLSSNILQQVEAPLLSQEDCRDYHIDNYRPDLAPPDTEICAGHLGSGPGVCRGDSGGPLACRDSEDNRWHLVGITSKVVDCGEWPALYTRVSRFHSFIESTIRQYEGYDANECLSSPCLNGATCNDRVGSYACTCAPGWTGVDCELDVDYCASVPCVNGLCVDGVNQYICRCNSGWTGTNCDINIDDCASAPCVNGVCVDGINLYTCVCDSGWTGTNCDTNNDDCASAPCVNGICVDGINQYTCRCNSGWTGTNCDISDDANECLSSPCLNGATCEDRIESYTCTCAPGWTGINCEQDYNECLSQPCRNQGRCLNDINAYSCICRRGWTGTRCETSLDDNQCLSNPCLNGATCDDREGSYTCTCAPDWTGINCELDTRINECDSVPCLHNGICIDGIGEYLCICANGWEGPVCEIEINECSSEPCQNGGTCINGITEYTCQCGVGYTGTNCEQIQNIAECSSDPCQNGGTCVDGINEYTCHCDAGYTGTHCEQNIDECSSDPCQNGGTCVDGINEITCHCDAGYTGTHCEQNIDECSSDPCRNGGICDDGINEYTCYCNPAYTGTHCEQNIDECSSDPCQNGGTCVDGFIEYTCYCDAGYTGTHCEQNINECSSEPCQNGGTCEDGINQYTCQCAPGYTSTNCEQTIDQCASCFNGQCRTDTNPYTCMCHPGWSGVDCDNNSDDIIIVADNALSKIFVGPINSLQLTEITLNSALYPAGVEFDPVNQKIYFTDLTFGSINRFNLDGTEHEFLFLGFLSDNKVPEGIALDIVNGRLFFTNRSNRTIEELTGLSESRVIIDENLDKPRAIVADTTSSRLFWTDWGTNPKIERANMDGSGRRTLINSDIIHPNGLAIDFQANLLYWCDAVLDRIEESDLNGQSRIIVATITDEIVPFDIGIYNNDLYWSDWRYIRLIKLTNRYNTTGRGVDLVGPAVFQKASGLHIHKAANAVQFQVRLVDGSNSNEGRVEIFHNVWGTVCDKALIGGLSVNNARVICRQLGLPYGAAQLVGNAAFGQGSGQIWQNAFGCSGSENRVRDCNYDGEFIEGCTHSNDVGVRCID
ncbi:uncharacterized protein [Amphiura filiformis]|uniref:uncharacterized protein n=1 Tax=Amphiura filiformis TaxID=82378 RepID=UPI003B20E4B2